MVQTINQSDIEHFRAEGYLIARNVINADIVQKVRQEIHETICQQLKYLDIRPTSEATADGIFASLKSLFAKDQSRYLATLRLCAKLCSVYQLYLDQNMLSIAKKLGIDFPVFQTQPVFHVMAEKLRIEDGYFGSGAHQDWPSLHSGLDTITTWVPMVPVQKNSFTLEIIPRTHMLGVLDAVEKADIYEVNPEAYRSMTFQPVEMNPGDALFFSTFLIHKSEKEGSADAFRAAFSMRYENAANKYFIRQKYPFAHKRVVARTLSAEAIPSIEEIKSVYQN